MKLADRFLYKNHARCGTFIQRVLKSKELGLTKPFETELNRNVKVSRLGRLILFTFHLR